MSDLLLGFDMSDVVDMLMKLAMNISESLNIPLELYTHMSESFDMFHWYHINQSESPDIPMALPMGKLH